MNVLVLGRGLLGSHLSKLYDVPVLGHSEIELTNPFSVDIAISNLHPDVVINCAGIVPKAESDPLQLFKVNAQGPKLLQHVCDELGVRLVHISTDCVFKGVKGNYDEIDIPNPDTLYGMSKYLGEVYESPHLTVRTSFVGFPDPRGHGLLSWAAEQERIVGFDKHLWNGLTTKELAAILFDRVLVSQLEGLIHIYGETVSKYDLLSTARDVFGWSFSLEKESEVTEEPHIVNRTLQSVVPEIQTAKTLREMLEEMKEAGDALR